METKPSNFSPVFLEGVPKVRNSAELKKCIQEAGNTLVCLCFLNDSEPSRKIAIRYQEMTRAQKDVIFLLGDVDECLDLMQAFSLTMVPTFILVQDKIVLEIFVGCSYYRVLRRVELQLIDDIKDFNRHNELTRIADIMHDKVYITYGRTLLPSDKKKIKFVDLLGLTFASIKPTWKDRTEMFVEACERVRHSKDFFSFLYEPQISDTSISSVSVEKVVPHLSESQKAEHEAKRISFGEYFDLSQPKKRDSHRFKKKAQEADSVQSQPLLQDSNRPLPTLEDGITSPVSDLDIDVYEDLRNTIFSKDLSLIGDDNENDEEKCTVPAELLVLEDKEYSKEEVEDLLKKCMRICWLAKLNAQLPLNSQPMPKTIDFGDELDILQSSSDESDDVSSIHSSKKER